MRECPATDTVRALDDEAQLSYLPISRLERQPPQTAEIVVADMQGIDEEGFARFNDWRFSPRGLVAPLILIVDDDSRKRVLRRGLNEGANLLKRPLEKTTLKPLIVQLHTANLARARKIQPDARDSHYAAFPEQAEGLKAGNAVLDDIFNAWSANEAFDADSIAERSAAIIECVGQTGLSDWVTAVRQHHDSTYQHCLLVTGTLLSIGHHLKMRRSDLGRLAVGGLLHDIGKADIPLDILDKPSRLSEHELIVMRSHPLAGVERLAGKRGATPEIIMLVRDHHEFLDGSGYPNRLKGDEISDFVRLLTIADIYSALMERRAYKPPMRADDAIGLMASMREQIDQALLAATVPVLRDVRT
jgi:putative nucleotidyltransferase with HDIG domain